MPVIHHSPTVMPPLATVTPQTKPQVPHALPNTLAPQDSNLIKMVPTGAIPAQIGLFANPGQTYVDNSLHQLQSSMSQQNFRDSQAAFRVSIRELSLADLDAAAQAIQSAMQHYGDYRTQVFLDEMSFDIKMERFDRDIRPKAIGQDLGAQNAADTVQKALAKLASSPTEANFRDARAAYRVSIRSLDVTALKEAKGLLQEAMQQTSDYRTQVFLEKARIDTEMEIVWKDRSYTLPSPQMPRPLDGSTGTEFVGSALARLGSSATEANFKTSQAAFRVAIRRLDNAGLDQAEAAVKAAINQNADYRTQIFLDGMLTDIKMQRFWNDRG